MNFNKFVRAYSLPLKCHIAIWGYIKLNEHIQSVFPVTLLNCTSLKKWPTLLPNEWLWDKKIPSDISISIGQPRLINQVSISSTFYARIFVRTSFQQLFSSYMLHVRKKSCQNRCSYVKCWWNWRQSVFVEAQKQFLHVALSKECLISLMRKGLFS